MNGFSEFPAGIIWCQNDAVLTLMRLHHVASTLIRRHFNVMYPLRLPFLFLLLFRTEGEFLKDKIVSPWREFLNVNLTLVGFRLPGKQTTVVSIGRNGGKTCCVNSLKKANCACRNQPAKSLLLADKGMRRYNFTEAGCQILIKPKWGLFAQSSS